MPSCCAVGCENRSTSNPNLKFYRIPAGAHPFQQNRRRLCLAAVNRANWSEEQIRNAQLCSAHFISGMASRIVTAQTLCLLSSYTREVVQPHHRSLTDFNENANVIIVKLIILLKHVLL